MHGLMNTAITTSFWKWLTWIWLAFTTFLLVIPGNALPSTRFAEIPYFDKWIHLFLFGVLSALGIKAFESARKPSAPRVVAWIKGYGIAMALVQHFLVISRSFDAWDIVADAAGALAGWLAYITIPSFSAPGNAR